MAWIPDEMVETIDDLVVSGVFASRSDVVRDAVVKLLDQHQRMKTALRIVEGYRRLPQCEDEVALADARTVAMIIGEPW